MSASKSQISMVTVTVRSELGDKVFRFREPFSVGRDEKCEVQIENPGISRRHVEVFLKGDSWWLKDLDSANGTFLQGKRVVEVPLGGSTEVELGLNDAILHFSVEGAEKPNQTVVAKPPSVTQYVQHYFRKDSEEASGEHTRMIRAAFDKVQKKEKSKYFKIIGVVLLIAIGFAIYSYFQHRELQRQKLLAEQIFYSMKSLELEISRLRSETQSNQPSEMTPATEQNQSQLLKLSQNLEKLSQSYEAFLKEIDFYDSSHWSETDRVILRVARTFGECEVAMPEEFLSRVYEYIENWKSSNRLQKALGRATDGNYAATVVEIMLQNHLPPQFFFLALQESDFVKQTVGPRTRYGIAKGMWQFIPATASRYGLKTGPLVELRRYDPEDDRYDFEKATRAAAEYIRDIYNTEAQASGLLVIASYNWGERNVHSLVQKLPENPRDRNFWKLLEKYGKRIPRETNNYVFRIVSAAVIGENPGLFGFDFDAPLTIPEEQAGQ